MFCNPTSNGIGDAAAPLGLEGRQVEHHTEEGAGPHRRPLPYSAVQQHLKEQVAGEAGQQGRQAGSYPQSKSRSFSPVTRRTWNQFRSTPRAEEATTPTQ